MAKLSAGTTSQVEFRRSIRCQLSDAEEMRAKVIWLLFVNRVSATRRRTGPGAVFAVTRFQLQ